MQAISIEKTLKTPTVILDAREGIIELNGRSLPEDSKKFYSPLIEWVEEYSKQPCEQTTVNIQLEYFNTSSSKEIFKIFKKLETIHSKSSEVKINWYCEDDDNDMNIAADDYASLIRIPFNKIEIE